MKCLTAAEGGDIHNSGIEMHKVGSREYPVIGYIKADGIDKPVPLVDIPMMSDERWNELARKNAVKNYIMEHGREPESVEQALDWQQERADRTVAACEARKRVTT